MSTILDVHKNSRQFISAIEFTAAQTGFQPELIEKDYFCSMILNDFTSQPQDILIFKGGTLLAKAHAGFYRLSEDLDFTISIATLATRKVRSQLAAQIKPIVNTIADRLPNLILAKKLIGSDESRQYNAEINYKSFLSQKQGRILIEIGMREEIQNPIRKEKINTLLLNPFTQKQYVPQFYFYSLGLQEAYAEKMRAALTRKKLAIRDFYDLDYAIKNNILDIDKPEFINLLKAKLQMPNSKCTMFDDDKLKVLKTKVFVELMPTLNLNQTISFDLDLIIYKLNALVKKHL